MLQELTLMHHTSCLCFSMQTGGQCEYEVRRDWRGQREGSLWLTAWDKTSSWILNTRSHEKVAWFNRWRTNWEQLCLRWLNKSRKAARHTHTFPGNWRKSQETEAALHLHHILSFQTFCFTLSNKSTYTLITKAVTELSRHKLKKWIRTEWIHDL